MTTICIIENHKEGTLLRAQQWLSDTVDIVDSRFGGEDYPSDITGYDGIILPGGGGTAWDNTMYPWLKWEYGLIKQAFDQHIPLLGICLGAQEIAYALNGTVEHRVRPQQSGMMTIHATDELHADQLLGDLPHDFPMIENHEDTITALPQGAVRLAWSEGSPNEAFRIGDCMWGVQFHPESSVDYLKSQWTTGLHKKYLESRGVNIQAVIDHAEPLDNANTEAARHLFDAFARVCQAHCSMMGKAA